MKSKTPKLNLQKMKGSTLFGLHMETNAASMRRDIPALSEKYHAQADEKPGTVLPLYVLTRDYDAKTKNMVLFVGGKIDERGLETEQTPDGLYAHMELRPKYGFLWAPAIAQAKQWFYEEWLPASKFEACNLEIEMHSQRTVSRRPVLDLYFALTEKGN